jgi:hypothetical protein
VLRVAAVQVVDYDDVWRLSPDAKTLSSLLLYERLAAAGKLSS